MNYTILYANWCAAQGTTPNDEEFERFQNSDLYTWLREHGWVETSHNARRSYWYLTGRQWWASVPVNINIDVRFYSVSTLTRGLEAVREVTA